MFNHKRVKEAIVVAFTGGRADLHYDHDTGSKVLIRSMPCGGVESVIRLSVYRCTDCRVLALEYPIYLGLDAIAGEFVRAIKQVWPLMDVEVPVRFFDKDLSAIKTESGLQKELKDMDVRFGIMPNTQYEIAEAAFGVRGKKKLPAEFYRNRYYPAPESKEMIVLGVMQARGYTDFDGKMFVITESGEKLFRKEHARRQNRFYTTGTPKCDGDCGMNYCDENGCVARKRVLTEPIPPPEKTGLW